MLNFVQSELEFFILCLTTLFTLINPLGISPILFVMTERFTKEEKADIALKGTLTATGALLVFVFMGSLIFNVFGITVEAFQIMGGILFFRSGLSMLEAKIGRTRTTPTEQEESQSHDDIAISPIGIPLIAGPGAITAAMLLSSQTPGIYSYGSLVMAVLIVLSVVYLILRNGDKIIKAIGFSGMRIIQRIMGLLLLVIAVQFVINGAEVVLKRIFH
ncbi:MAG: NAAT family transporter [Candidatus Marinimicrobia bacterium]|nr:NAAT family transporter [Candidatus Neomarinimicrobiota bacterium]